MAETSTGKGGLTVVTLRSPEGYTAQVYTHGAHVTSWKTPAGEEQIFVSEHAIFTPPTAIRGGIPICWPQFGDMGPCKAQHGFTRNSEFRIIDSTAPNSVTMELAGTGAAPADFPVPFILRCRVTVNDGWLDQELTVINPEEAAEPLRFTTALHTYFRLANGIDSAEVRGLSGCRYLDNLQARKECVESAETVTFEVGEVDRIYCGTPAELGIVDGGSGGGRTVRIVKNGFPDAVVWNPHVEKSAKMKDFGDDEWKDMVCVEVAVAGSGPVEVAPGAQWSGSQRLSIQ